MSNDGSEHCQIPPKVAIVVLNYNGMDDTIDCLHSLQRLGYPNHEIIVVDQNSRDRSAEVIERDFPHVRLVRNERNLGFAGGCNVGMDKAWETEARYVLLLNNDTIVEPDFLQPMVNLMESDDTIGMTQPLVLFAEYANVVSSAGGRFDEENLFAELLGMWRIDYQLEKAPYEVDWVGGTALLVRRDVVERIGPLDESYFLYYEDVDWSFRARAAGYKCCVVPTSRIQHRGGGATFHQSLSFLYYMSRNRIRFLTRYRSESWQDCHASVHRAATANQRFIDGTAGPLKRLAVYCGTRAGMRSGSGKSAVVSFIAELARLRKRLTMPRRLRRLWAVHPESRRLGLLGIMDESALNTTALDALDEGRPRAANVVWMAARTVDVQSLPAFLDAGTKVDLNPKSGRVGKALALLKLFWKTRCDLLVVPYPSWQLRILSLLVPARARYELRGRFFVSHPSLGGLFRGAAALWRSARVFVTLAVMRLRQALSGT